MFKAFRKHAKHWTRSGSSQAQLGPSKVKEQTWGEGGSGIPQESNEIDTCSCTIPTERHMVSTVDSWSSFTVPKRLNRQTVGGRSSGSLLGGDLPALALVDSRGGGVFSVYKAYEALAELSGFLDKALLLQRHWRLANNRGNILICIGFSIALIIFTTNS